MIKLTQIFLLLLLAISHSQPAWSQQANQEEQPTVVATKEYFVQQLPDEAMVVRISANEAQFIARLSSEDGQVSLESGLPGETTFPIYQYVPNSDSPRQIDINVFATQVTNRTDFELQQTRIRVRDEFNSTMASAFHLLSAAQFVLPNGTPAQWTVRIQTLFRAADTFEEVGMEEMKLRTQSYAAALILDQMSDPQTALDWANQILAEPRISRYPDVAFTALKLKSSAMVSGRIGNDASDPTNSPLQKALGETIESARNQGYKLEESLALKAAGVNLIDQGQHRQARGFLESALSIADEIEAGDLAASIREHMVETHSQEGNLDATGEILEDIETHLVEEGDEQELALNLIQQGTVHYEAGRYHQAAEVFSRALALEQGELSRLQSELALGGALNASGRHEQALNHLYRGVRNPGTGEFRPSSDVLNVNAGLYEIAGIHRFRAEWDELQQIRQAQNRSANSPVQSAQFAFARAVDSLVYNGRSSATTKSRFEQARQQANDADQETLEKLSHLGLCGLASTASPPECSTSSLRNAYQYLELNASPQHQTTGALWFAQFLDRTGQSRQALDVLDAQLNQLIAEGVSLLGAWYWQWREPLSNEYMKLAISLDQGDDATASFLALIRIRAMERHSDLYTSPITANLLDELLNSLPSNSIILSYFLGNRSTQAWVASAGSVKRFSLGSDQAIRELSQRIRQLQPARRGEELQWLGRELGAELLEPLAQELPENIFLLAQAPLLGIPLDALYLDGQPLASSHKLINFELPNENMQPQHRIQPFAPTSVFLAGDAQDWSGDYAFSLNSSGEMQAVNDLFVGPGLHVVRGVALLSDEFQDQRYGDSDLLHLSIPGTVDLSPGHQSSLFLSEPTRGSGRETLDEQALSAIPVRANLAFLSRTEVNGVSSAAENRMGVVSALLDAGAGAVISSLWAVEPAFRDQFVEDFYVNLMEENNISTALALTKRASIASGNASDWASFQLFLN